MRENVSLGDVREFKLVSGARITGILVENNYVMESLTIAGNAGIKEIGYTDIEQIGDAEVTAIQREALDKLYKYYRMYKKLAEKRNEIDGKMGQLEKAMKTSMTRYKVEDRGYTDQEFAIGLIKLLDRETNGELRIKGYEVRFKRVGPDALRVVILRHKKLDSNVAFEIEVMKTAAEQNKSVGTKEGIEGALKMLGEDNFKYHTRHGVNGVYVKETTEVKEDIYRHQIIVDVKAEKLTRHLLKSLVSGMTKK